jgi:tetratricopeptide (TPR) repeat protein
MTPRFRIAIVLAVSIVPFVFAQKEAGYSNAGLRAYELRKDFAGAVRYALEWTHAEPNNAVAWANLGIAYGSKGHQIGLQRPDLALPALRKAVTLDPKLAMAWNALGWVARELNKVPEEQEAFEYATQLRPDNANYWGNLAGAYAAQANGVAKAQAAVDQMEKATQGSTVAEAWYNLGNDLGATGINDRSRLQRAAAAYKRALQLKPNLADAWNNLGTLEEMAGHFPVALDYYQRAAKLGDRLGQNNYSQLQAAIAASREKNAARPVDDLGRRQERISREYQCRASGWSGVGNRPSSCY